MRATGYSPSWHRRTACKVLWGTPLNSTATWQGTSTAPADQNRGTTERTLLSEHDICFTLHYLQSLSVFLFFCHISRTDAICHTVHMETSDTLFSRPTNLLTWYNPLLLAQFKCFVLFQLYKLHIKGCEQTRMWCTAKTLPPLGGQI